MSPRLDSLLGRIFRHHYPETVDRVDWREARALWRAEEAQRLGVAPVTTPLRPDEGPWAPIDYIDI